MIGMGFAILYSSRSRYARQYAPNRTKTEKKMNWKIDQHVEQGKKEQTPPVLIPLEVDTTIINKLPAQKDLR
jgi:hypothetical protein